jgi:hypothetical protein
LALRHPSAQIQVASHCPLYWLRFILFIGLLLIAGIIIILLKKMSTFKRMSECLPFHAYIFSVKLKGITALEVGQPGGVAIP